MRFVDLTGDKKEHYKEVREYARERQKEELRVQEEKQIREWFAAELDNMNCLRMESGDIMKYIAREVAVLKKIFGSWTFPAAELDTDQLWTNFLLYNFDFFAGFFATKEKRRVFIAAFSKRVLRLDPEAVKEFTENQESSNRKYLKYIKNCYSLEKDGDMYFWRFLCQTGDESQVERYGEEYLKFIYYYAFYLSLTILETTEFDLCEKSLKEYRNALQKIVNDKKKNRFLLPDFRKLKSPLHDKSKLECLQNIEYSMKVILFRLDKNTDSEEGEFEMIEELYRQIRDQEIKFEKLESILPEEIKQNITECKLPDFSDYDLDILQEKEKVRYLDHTVLYQGKQENDEIQFNSYKGVLLFTDKRMIFNSGNILELEYEKISRVVQYDVTPEMLEIRSGNKISYFQIPDADMAYKILKLIVNCKKGKDITEQPVPLSYEELVDKADINGYIFAFEYMASGNLPQKLKEILEKLNYKLAGLQKTIEKFPQKKTEIYQFLHYYIPEAVKLVKEYQGYQGVGLEDITVNNVYEKVITAVQTLDSAVYQKILEIYQTATRDTVAGAEALKEILGQDGYMGPSYKMNR